MYVGIRYCSTTCVQKMAHLEEENTQLKDKIQQMQDVPPAYMFHYKGRVISEFAYNRIMELEKELSAATLKPKLKLDWSVEFHQLKELERLVESLCERLALYNSSLGHPYTPSAATLESSVASIISYAKAMYPIYEKCRGLDIDKVFKKHAALAKENEELKKDHKWIQERYDALSQEIQEIATEFKIHPKWTLSGNDFLSAIKGKLSAYKKQLDMRVQEFSNLISYATSAHGVDSGLFRELSRIIDSRNSSDASQTKEMNQAIDNIMRYACDAPNAEISLSTYTKIRDIGLTYMSLRETLLRIVTFSIETTDTQMKYYAYMKIREIVLAALRISDAQLDEETRPFKKEYGNNCSVCERES